MSAIVRKTEVSNQADFNATWQEKLSACTDGELTKEQYQQMWKEIQSKSTDSELHEHWATWSLVGDLMREPNHTPLHASEPFIANFRQRLAMETGKPQPADQPLKVLTLEAVAEPGREAANAAVFRWKMVAGFASLAAVTAISWTAVSQLSQPSQTQLAQTETQAPLSVASASHPQGLTLVSRNTGGLAATEMQSDPLVGNSAVMIRDPRLDEVLSRQQSARLNTLQPSANFLQSTNLQGFGYQPSMVVNQP